MSLFWFSFGPFCFVKFWGIHGLRPLTTLSAVVSFKSPGVSGEPSTRNEVDTCPAGRGGGLGRGVGRGGASGWDGGVGWGRCGKDYVGLDGGGLEGDGRVGVGIGGGGKRMRGENAALCHSIANIYQYESAPICLFLLIRAKVQPSDSVGKVFISK